MKFQEFKVWLFGYLEGINLSEEHTKRIMEEVREVRIETDDVYVPVDYSKLFNSTPEILGNVIKENSSCSASINGGCFCDGSCNRPKHNLSSSINDAASGAYSVSGLKRNKGMPGGDI